MPDVNKRYKATDVGIEGYYKNLVITNNASNPNTQIDITADTVYLATTDTPPKLFRWRSVSETANVVLGVAVNGLDAGVEAINTMYALWLIGKSDLTVIDCLLSTSFSAPTMPSGYDCKLLVGAIRNGGGTAAIDPEGSGHFNRIYQTGRVVRYINRKTVVTAKPGDANWTGLDFATTNRLIPSNSTTALVLCKMVQGGTAVAADLHLSNVAAGVYSATYPGILVLEVPNVINIVMSTGLIDSPLTTVQVMTYRQSDIAANTPTPTIYLCGYILNL